MNVKHLIAELQTLPLDAEVYFLYSNQAINVDRLWLARAPLPLDPHKGERALLSNHQTYINKTENRPIEAPTAEEEKNWRIAKLPYNFNSERL